VPPEPPEVGAGGEPEEMRGVESGAKRQTDLGLARPGAQAKMERRR
jgi:hypothetical protein